MGLVHDDTDELDRLGAEAEFDPTAFASVDRLLEFPVAGKDVQVVLFAI